MKKPTPYISEAATINDAILAFGNCSHTLLPIVDAEGKLTSIVTKTDVYRAMTHGQEFREQIGTIAKREVAALYEGQAVREALRVLYMKDVKQAPVLDHQSRPIGILSHMDVAEARIRLEHQKSDSHHLSSHNPRSGNQT
jgi:CBS domain-containing protein